MNNITLIPIFKTGRHVALNGVSLEFTVADLQAAADAYKPEVHEAPLVVGHPSLDAPAYGWVASLQLEEETLLAQPRQVDEGFADLIREGRYKKISASFYCPDSPSNPQPGIYYLRHVGFLGAQPPAVKGLPDPAFAEEPEGIITLEFGESDHAYERLWQRLRQWMANRFGQEEADAVLPVRTAPVPQAVAAFAEREAMVTQRELALRQQEMVSFVETQVAAGRVTPGDRQGLVALCNLLSSSGVVAFGEEGEDQTLLAWFRDWLARQPVVVDYAERTAEGENSTLPGYQPPAGYVADARALAMHQQVLAHAQRHGVDYVTALRAVGRP